jgi:glutathione peroxidase
MKHAPLIPLILAGLLAGACGSQPAEPGTAAGATPPAERSVASLDDVTENPETMTFYDLKTESLEGEPVDLSAYRGKVTLVVNVASACGYTPQYAGLQQLHAELKDRGFAVLGFPSNDFGGQEPGSPEQIREFCSSRFAVDFPMFAKVQTRPGEGQSPVYALLGTEGGSLPNWNFCKYLVGKDGKVIGFFPSKVAPDSADLRAKIEAAL